MGKFYADIDGSTQPRFDLASWTYLSTGGGQGLQLEFTEEALAAGAGASDPFTLMTSRISATTPNEKPSTFTGGIGIKNYDVDEHTLALNVAPGMAAPYSLNFPGAAPSADALQILAVQGSDLAYVPYTALAAGACKIHKLRINWNNPALVDGAVVTLLQLPSQAELWRIRAVVFAAADSPIGFKLGTEINPGRYVDCYAADGQHPINGPAGTTFEAAPDEMDADGVELVATVKKGAATTGSITFYTEYFVPA